MTQISVQHDAHNINKILYIQYLHIDREIKYWWFLQIRIKSLHKQTIYTIVLTNECKIYDIRYQ